MQSLMLTARQSRVRLKEREVSERRQVGDVGDLVNSDESHGPEAGARSARWWRNEGIDEGM